MPGAMAYHAGHAQKRCQNAGLTSPLQGASGNVQRMLCLARAQQRTLRLARMLQLSYACARILCSVGCRC